MQKLKNFEFNRIPTRQIQLFCLVTVALIQLFNMVFGATVEGRMASYVVFYATAMGVLFFGVSTRESMSRKARNLLLLGLGFSLWILLLQVSDYRHFEPTAYYGARFTASAFFCEYLMLLPFGAIADEGDGAKGLKLAAGIYAAGILAYLILTALVYLNRVPSMFSRFCGWVEVRLGLNWHPNITGQALSIAIGFTLALVCGVRKKWMQAGLLVLAAGGFVVLALTNARATTLLTCCIFGGIVFYLIWQPGTEKATVIRFLAGLGAAAVVILALFSSTDWIARKNSLYVTQIETPEVEVNSEYAENRVRDIGFEFWTFNGRTDIWSSAFQGLGEDPGALITGVEDPGELITRYNEEPVGHAHNSWMETLLRLGVVGLGFALVLTVLAVRDCISLMFLKRSTFFQKVICMQVICLLGSDFFEPYLFYAEAPYQFINAAFLLCLGYLEYWNYRAEPLKQKKV